MENKEFKFNGLRANGFLMLFVTLAMTLFLVVYMIVAGVHDNIQTGWLIAGIVLFVLATSAWCLYTLPLFDFRPYHIGADIKQGMEIPEGETGPQFETTFIMEKDGERREFTIDDYPDSTWAFIDSKSVQTAEGYTPPIHDFSIVRLPEEDDITDVVLSDTSYVMLLVSTHLEQADDARLDLINQLYEYCQEHGYPFYCLTASTEKAMTRWRDMTGAEYPFCATDETTLKTIVRSNPGLLLLKGGVVIRKWSHNALPVMTEEQLALPLEQQEIGRLPDDTVSRKIARIMLWFVLPLALLTIADRLWMWTKWLRRKRPTTNGAHESNETNETHESHETHESNESHETNKPHKPKKQ